MVALHEQHLQCVVQEFVEYYNVERPHRTLGRGTPFASGRPMAGEIRSTSMLGSLHHVYRRAA